VRNPFTRRLKCIRFAELFGERTLREAAVGAVRKIDAGQFTDEQRAIVSL
jgi:hypothetical protein